MVTVKSDLQKAPLTPLGRRILIRWALLSPDGDLSIRTLGRILGCRDARVFELLKTKQPGWVTKREYIDVVDALCRLLKVDQAWLLDTVDYGPLGELNFALRKRDTRGLNTPVKGSLNASDPDSAGRISS